MNPYESPAAKKKITTANFYLMWACVVVVGIASLVSIAGAVVSVCELLGLLDDGYGGIWLCLGGCLVYQMFHAAGRAYCDRWRAEFGLKPYDWGKQ